MDAITLLKEDHRLFKKLLEEGDETTERAKKTRMELLDRLVTELKVHEKIEEEIFYPALREYDKTKEIVLEGFEEHHVADLIAAELKRTDVSDERWAAKWSVLKENLEHHIEEEEEDMFKKARTLLDKSELVALGERMQAVKRQAGKEAA
jgi:hypothetical protein